KLVKICGTLGRPGWAGMFRSAWWDLGRAARILGLFRRIGYRSRGRPGRIEQSITYERFADYGIEALEAENLGRRRNARPGDFGWGDCGAVAGRADCRVDCGGRAGGTPADRTVRGRPAPCSVPRLAGRVGPVPENWR